MAEPLPVSMSSVTALHLLLQRDSDTNAITESRIQFVKSHDPSGVNLQWRNASILIDALAISQTFSSISALCRQVSISYVALNPNLHRLAARSREALASNLSEDEL